MPINHDAAEREPGPPTEASWTSKDALLYAVGVGAGSIDPTGAELEFTTENSKDVQQRVLPTFAVIVGMGGGAMAAVGPFNMANLVHGEQAIELHGEIPVAGTVRTSGRVLGVYDKGSAAVVVSESESVDAATGAPLFTTRNSMFIRGEGGWGGDRGPSGPKNVAPDRAPDHELTYQTRPDQALTYRLSGDRNPLHSDPEFAKMAGFPKPILHGLCTYGFTGRALLHSLCGSDPARFTSMEGRFSKPVYPGDALTVKMWVDEGPEGTQAIFRTESQNGDIVIDQGAVHVHIVTPGPIEGNVMADQDNRNSTAPGYGGDASALDDLFDMSAPQPRYVALIEQAPAMPTMDGMVMVNSRAAVDEALRDPSRFSSAFGGGIVLGNTRPLIPLSVDPPDHSKYRKILDPLFAPRRMDAIEDDVAARVNHFVDAFADRGGCHFTNEFATPFPSSVFLGLMGLPWEELDTFLRMKNGIIRPGSDIPDPHERMRVMLDQEERLRIQHETGQDIYRYFDEILDQRAVDPKDDILSHFLGAEVDGDTLSREEILDICFLFLIAGLDTVTDSLTCFFAFLAEHPEHRRQIVDDPSVIPAAVEELLRWETPVPGVPRFCTQDGDIAGRPVKAGDALLVQVGSANVDPAVFPDGFDVRFDREANPHIAFGGGVHRCLGSHLARRELRVALREWHRRIPDYELKPGIELEYATGLRTVENLELVW